jgi:ubiquinone/menaquinone biosynthesis C-methylase UbiE
VTAPLHTERFSGRVPAYAAHRPRFPQGILAFLRQHNALRENAVVADIGAGTGMLAELFLEAGHRVIAVEPNDEMLEACRELTVRCPALELVKGTAEATTLPEASVDLIVVGRAMHWFDWLQAQREFQRILRRHGWVLVATNGHRDSGSAVSEQLADIFHRWRTDSAEADSRRDFNERLPAFLDVASWHRTILRHAMKMDFATLLGYAESLSAIPRPGEQGYEEMVTELREVFGVYQREGLLETPLGCELFLGRLREHYAADAN